MSIDLDDARRAIDDILDSYRDAARTDTAESLLPERLTTGKAYEAWVLCEVLERLHHDEGCDIRLVGSDAVRLKSSGGPINRSYAHFVATRRSDSRQFEVWTDVEFSALSAALEGRSGASLSRCDYHELDIVIVPAGTWGRPNPAELLVGVECKNLDYQKDMLRSLLGVRRELSFLQDPRPTAFRRWPRASVPANPPSCLLAYGTDPNIIDFADPGRVFGIDFHFEPLGSS
ncbi:MAG: hypothetical protein J7513_12415 [Solirubrobacteraceae bacterium]|nr:hypothetical protein [Solirubrobacteraceae bacterium]